MLILVPTPIGNLEDVTIRALRVLREADLIACEDTRTTGNLLARFEIETPLTSYHDHNERTKAPQLVARMSAGGTVALVTDAGTPGISDPGFYLVRECLQQEIKVQALPGPSAFVTALVASGLPSDRFVFEGFLPHKKGRATRIRDLSSEHRTLIFYESPHRLVRMLTELSSAFGDERPAAVARELTKKFEEIRRGSLSELRVHFEAQPRVRGEIVVVVGGAA